MVQHFTSPNVFVLAAIVALLGTGSVLDLRAWSAVRQEAAGEEAARERGAHEDAVGAAGDEPTAEASRRQVTASTGLVGVVWAALPPLGLLVASLVRHSFNERYAAISVPGIALVLGAMLCRLLDWVSLRVRGLGSHPQVGLAGLVLLSLVVLLPTGQPSLFAAQDGDWRAAATPSPPPS